MENRRILYFTIVVMPRNGVGDFGMSASSPFLYSLYWLGLVLAMLWELDAVVIIINDL